MERWQPERLPARFQPRRPRQLESVRTWLPVTAAVAIIAFGALVYALLPTGDSLYRVIMSASHSAPAATPPPGHTLWPAPPALRPTR
jgi:hypothetical protein